jgi:tetratricopeptide (TPR) repeat protein
MFRRLAAGFALVGFLGSAAAAQDVVHLRNGKVLSGTIVFDADSKAGFTLRRWDTGGEVFVKWSQVPDAEAYRIRTRVTGTDGEVAAEDMIDAVRIVTNMQRELLGVIQSERDGNISIKTLEGVQQTAKSAEVLREAVKVKESEVYTPEERVDRRVKKAGEADFAKLKELGDFAAAVKVFVRAKEFYERAEKAAPADKKEDMKALANAMTLRIVEDNAEKALASARKLATELEFDKAVAEAMKFLADFAETSVAKANANLVSEIENRRKEYIANRDKFLEKDVPDQWWRVRDTLIAKYAGGKVKLPDAREAIAKLDDEIVAEVAKKLKATPEEVTRHWSGRKDKRMRTVSMKDGTWIHRGGQDGGLDYSGSGDDDLDEFKKRFGDGQDPKKKPQLGQKLETAIEWWQNASNRSRRDWLECLYADTSSNVKKEEVIETNCAPCKGQGKKDTNRGGKAIEVVCRECHGVKKVLTIKYW